ncbi:pre-mRNA-splicing factor cwc24 [Polytolypa hystricis UAMH7299]|uniref:Pre-mRNA-splicing factor CWC24 n=1 Tax=Polytolypa hystricis (strain UAMH7299) TaxID=1447883 RepID=A0A2B7X960_POLH7|nr:pre-mRNA-splicing factor cwc24 [Polytolypa hystricis UAMH7299]
MENPEADQTVPQITFKKRSAKSKSNFRRKAPSPQPASASESEYSSSDGEGGRQAKRRRKNGGVTVSSSAAPRREEEPATAPSTGPVPFSSNDATKQSNWYDEGKEDDLSVQNLLGKTRSRPGDTAQPAAPDGTYRGAANYTSFIQKNPDTHKKHFGPIKAPTNIRTITVTDFAPDVCKDYKQTGFCGFGDSCKFLHAREDYKQGWELDRDWEISTKGKKLVGRTVASSDKRGKTAEDDEDDEDEELLESIPFACIICKKPYKDPIVTRCGHYFCESCALQRYRKHPTCAACGEGTGGVFNVAKKLNQLLERKRERARKRREKAIEEGEEVSDEKEEGDESE